MRISYFLPSRSTVHSGPCPSRWYLLFFIRSGTIFHTGCSAIDSWTMRCTNPPDLYCDCILPAFPFVPLAVHRTMFFHIAMLEFSRKSMRYVNNVGSLRQDNL